MAPISKKQQIGDRVKKHSATWSTRSQSTGWIEAKASGARIKVIWLASAQSRYSIYASPHQLRQLGDVGC
jgi:hypothetical protein